MSRSKSPNRKIHKKQPKNQRKFHKKYEHCKVISVNCNLPSSTVMDKPLKPPFVTDTKLSSMPPLERADHMREYREKQKEIRDKYSPKTKEIYVNPANKRALRPRIINLALGGEPIPEHSSKQAQTPKRRKKIKPSERRQLELSADEILSEAHRMIWFWLFNGLFPTDLHKQKIINESK